MEPKYGFVKCSQALASCTYFQHFLQKVVEECEEQEENLPLSVALASLLEGNIKTI